MIIFDEIMSWSNPGAAITNRCRIRIIKLNGHGPVVHLKGYYIVATDLGQGAGTSITNSAKFLIPWICDGHEINIEDMVWFENYPDNPSLDVAIPKPVSACCPGCSKMIDVTWRPARGNEIEHVKSFIPDII